MPKPNQAGFGIKSLRSLNPQTWNIYHFKTSEDIDIFKKTIKTGMG